MALLHDSDVGRSVKHPILPASSCMYCFPLHCNRSRLPTPGPIVKPKLGALCPLIPLLPLLLPHHPEEAYPRATNTCPTVPHTAKTRP